MNEKFKNPYADCDENEVSRLNANISTEDFNFVRRIRVDKGTIQTTINILWSKLVNELKQRGITDFSREADYEDFLVNIRLVDERECTEIDEAGGGVVAASAPVGSPTAVPAVAGAEHVDNEPGRPAPIRDATPGVKDVGTNVPRRSRGGGRKGQNHRKEGVSPK